MNSVLLIIIGFPILEIVLMIKIGKAFGVLNTVLLILFTAIVGIYYARIEGLNTIRSGMINLYQNKLPLYEMISGASIAIAAMLLILPGFVSDAIGFLLLIPFTRKLLINLWFRNKYKTNHKPEEDIIDAEIIEEEKNKDEL
ncbi:FxsA family protein [Pelagibacteraceae bacterium]|nr:FxsA family protein [Pelagibacteraceae bacterium]